MAIKSPFILITRLFTDFRNRVNDLLDHTIMPLVPEKGFYCVDDFPFDVVKNEIHLSMSAGVIDTNRFFRDI